MDLFKKEERNQLKEENARLNARIKELEETVENLNKVINEKKQKEESISSAIVFAVERSNQLEASRKKIHQLDMQRSRLLYMRMEQVLNELYSRYPELKKDARLMDMSEKFKQSLYSNPELTANENYISQQNIKEDPIRKLLGNIINYIDDEKQGKNISRGNVKIPKPTTYEKKSDYGQLDYMQNNFQPSFATVPSNSGFDINEALHPSESLEEILKAFDLNNKKKNK